MKLWKVGYSSCWKISHICQVDENKGEKVKIPTIVPLLYWHVCPKYFIKQIYMSLYVYCVSHELRIGENSGFKRKDYSNQLLALTYNILNLLILVKSYVLLFLMCQKLLIMYDTLDGYLNSDNLV